MEKTNGFPLENVTSFLSFSSERVIIAEREHWIVLAAPITFLLFIAFFLHVLVSSFFSFIHPYIPYLLISNGIIILLFYTFLTKIVMEWYFHFYVVTNHKILEVSYKPFLSETMNDILLDRVRCTEIDVQVRGILEELLDIGNITITFDRPTHQETLTLCHIRSPREISLLLAHNLGQVSLNDSQLVWYKTQKRSLFQFTDEIIPQVKKGVSL